MSQRTRKKASKSAPARKTANATAAEPGAADRSPLAIGRKAPAFRLPRDGGGTVSLDDLKGRRLVIFFYPRAGTPGCTREATDFSRLAAEFAALGTSVLGVSADPLPAQERFRDKHGLTVPLLSDATHAMLEVYGVWSEKLLYGKTFMGIVRTTVAIGPDRRVLHVWRNVRVDGHAEAVLDYVKNLEMPFSQN